MPASRTVHMPPAADEAEAALTPAQREEFETAGFVRLEQAFAPGVARACVDAVWADLSCDPDDRRTWTRPVVHVAASDRAPFQQAADSRRLAGALDQLLGVGAWRARDDLGNVVVRFPHPTPTRDAHWHIDASYPAPSGPVRDYGAWYVNHRSDGRALLLLSLLTDVGDGDGPTRLRAGSHRHVPQVLAPFGDAGLPGRDANDLVDRATSHLPEVHATGSAGDVYLCDPLLVHAAQDVASDRVRVLAQAGIAPAGRSLSPR